jgi:hypothetical protein
MKFRVLLLLGLLSSCFNETKTLPESSGSVSEILFVVDDSLWDIYISDIVNNIFGNEILGISKSESTFKIIQINYSEFSSLFKTHKNIVLISDSSSFTIVNNNWAKNQIVSRLRYKNNAEKFKLDCVKIYNVFYDNELLYLKKNILHNYNNDLTQIVKREFNIDIVIPNEYSLVLDSSDVLWFTYNPPNKEEIKHILVFSIEDTSENLRDYILFKTDTLLSHYLKGTKKNSYVKLENQYSPVFFRDSYRGIWKLHNGFMGGPIVIKPYFLDENIVITAALVFNPQSTKRKYIKEFEATL